MLFILLLHYILLIFFQVEIIGGGGQNDMFAPNIFIGGGGGDCPPAPPPPPPGSTPHGNGSGVAAVFVVRWQYMLWDRVGLNVVGWGWGKRWDTSYTAQTHIHHN